MTSRRLLRPIPDNLTVTDLVDTFFLSYNAARLREACQLMAQKILRPDVTVGLALSGALTPTGLGYAAIVPLIEAGFIDWIVSTGANLYHDIHRSLGLELHHSTPNSNDVDLRERRIVRIYDILLEEQVLIQTDAFLYQCLELPEFQHRMSSAELHYRLGRYTLEREKVLGIQYRSILSTAYEMAVPIYTPSPGDSAIGMDIAALRAIGLEVGIDPEADVIETTAIVYNAKRNDGKSAVIVLGGGSPKNFALQTEPQLQELLENDEKGHDYFIQITDARPDTGGSSGATPQEAVTWGKMNPSQLSDTVVCYTDSTIALPILAAYVLDQCPRRSLRRLYDQRSIMVDDLIKLYRSKWSNARGKT